MRKIMDRTHKIGNILLQIDKPMPIKEKCIQMGLDLKTGKKNLKQFFFDDDFKEISPEVMKIYQNLYGQRPSDIDFWEEAKKKGKIKKIDERKFYYDPTD